MYRPTDARFDDLDLEIECRIDAICRRFDADWRGKTAADRRLSGRDRRCCPPGFARGVNGSGVRTAPSRRHVREPSAPPRPESPLHATIGDAPANVPGPPPTSPLPGAGPRSADDDATMPPGDHAGLADCYVNRGLAQPPRPTSPAPRPTSDEPGACTTPCRRGRASSGSGPRGARRAGRTVGATGSGLSSAEAASESDAAMALVHKAVAMGYRGHFIYRYDDALLPFRHRADFRLLLMDLAMPAQPFARRD